MKKGITIGIALVLAVIVGGVSMGCIDYTIDDAFPTNDGGLTAQGLQVKADVVERQARGFVQYTGANNTTVIVTVPDVVIEPVVNKPVPVISYCRCYAAYPDNVAGFDTPMERAYIYQGMLNDKMAAMDTLTVSQYLTPSGMPYEDFYQAHYQDLQNKYQKMYCTVGNKVIGDFELYLVDNSTGNSSVGNFSA